MNESQPPDDQPNPLEREQQGIVMPDGSTFGDNVDSQRQQKRESEDQDYIPVIIKRTDETRRHPDDAMENAIEEGLEQLGRPALSLLLSAVAAGLLVGFSAMAVAVVLTATGELGAPEMVRRIAAAFVYPLGFVVCVLSGAQLFTEHTATALYPVLDRQSTAVQLFRLWAIVIVGNLFGALACGGLHYLACDVVGARVGYLEIGHHLTKFDNADLIISAILAGWLMALAAWLAASSPRTLAQITVIYMATFLIGIGGLHHSIAGSVEMFTAMFLSSEVSPTTAVNFISIALLGNWIGGTCFVALLNYAHIRRTND